MQFLTMDNVSVQYPFQHKRVLERVNLSINKGEIILILGPSGAGKSTLALTLNGIIPRTIEAEMNGSVEMLGSSIIEKTPRELSERIGMLFQDPDTQFCMLTVEDEILFGLENLRLSRAEMEVRLEKSLEIVGLSEWRKAQIKELSGGMKQKLGIACLIAMDADLFILDEPTANLDPMSTDEIFSLLLSLAKEYCKTLVLIEHKLDYLLPHVDRIIMLDHEGQIILDDDPCTIFMNEYDTVVKQGIWVPYICQAAKKLEKQGFGWDKFPLSLEQWERECKKFGFELQADYKFVDEQQQLNQHNEASPILQFRNVTFAYTDRSILNKIDFSIQAGQFVSIVGPNGTGKSTLAQLIVGLLKPTSGNIYLNGYPVTKLRTSEIMQQIGFVFQNPEHQFICDTVEEELAYSLKILGWEENARKKRVDEMLKTFHLVHQRQQNPFTLSQGQKRRLSVATMLISDQQLLILDEPTFGQDGVNTEALMKLLVNLQAEGKTIMMITHDMDLVYRYADNVILLREGSIRYAGDVVSFFMNEDKLHESSITVPLSFTLERWMKSIEERRTYVRTLPKK